MIVHQTYSTTTMDRTTVTPHSNTYSAPSNSQTLRSDKKRRKDKIRYARRARKREHEDRMRNLLRKHASEQNLTLFQSSEGSIDALSSASTESLESATSRQSQLLSMLEQTSFRHLRVFVTFEFGLLTSEDDAPPQGPYETLRPTVSEGDMKYNASDLKNKSEILCKILHRTGPVSSNALQQRSGNVLMFVSPERSPFVTFVKRDYNYESPKNRPGVVRCVVSAVIPISIASDGSNFAESSKIMAKVIVRKALIKGVEKKQLFP